MAGTGAARVRVVGVVRVVRRRGVMSVVAVHEVRSGATRLTEEREVGGPGHVRGGHEGADQPDDHEHGVVEVTGGVDDLVLGEEAAERTARRTARRSPAIHVMKVTGIFLGRPPMSFFMSKLW